jgi:polyol permease family
MRNDMNTNSTHRALLGMPLALMGGYIAILFCMTGDGIEQAFLSKYLVNLGFSGTQASLVFTVYGAAVAFSSLASGILSEMFSPKKIMLVGVVWWLVFHVLFLQFGLSHANLPLILFFYGVRGFAYPLFFYGFFVWVVQNTPGNQLASAVGWIWCMFTIGYGIIGSYLPSFTIRVIGFMGTLWMSLAWVLVGGLIILFTTKTSLEDEVNKAARNNKSQNRVRDLSKAVTLIFENRNMGLAFITRIICNLSLFGFPVVMPLFYTSRQIGFTTSQWLMVWGTFFVVQPFTNVMWGNIGDRMGWMRQMRWVGFVGCGTATLLFYYLPYLFPHRFSVAILVALLFALTVTSFVPMGAIFPMIEPEHKGAAISVQNLGGGLSNFLGPAIATLVFAKYGIGAIVILYAMLYYVAAGITCFIKVNQPSHANPGIFMTH